MLSLLIESALRSMVLGGAVWLLLKLSRVRNPHIERTTWSMVLLASVAMPLLSQSMTIATPVPALMPIVSMDSIAVASSRMPDWGRVMLFVYLAVAGALLTRQLAGLVRGWRIRGRAIRVHESWAQALDIRRSAEIGAPATFSSTILFPEKHHEWSETKRQAVLAHEKAHVRNRDFHLQLLARIHRAVFWFSPFAWWLARKLPLISEELSDDAAISAIGDRFGYAQMLVDFTHRPATHGEDLPAGVAMAALSSVAGRIERVVADQYRLRRLSPTHRALVAIAVLPAIVCAAACSTGDGDKARHVATPGASAANTQPADTGLEQLQAESENVTKPKSNPAYPLSWPPYPAKSRQSGEQGTVIMRLHVLEDGSVDDVKIHKSSGFPLLDDAAANQALAWHLDPGTVDGRPAPSWGRFAVTFKLD